MIHAASFTRSLEQGRTIKGRVRDRESHQPIAGMWVGPRNEPWVGLVSGTYPWVTDEEGRFTITGLYPNDGAHDPLKLTAVSPPGITYDAAAVEVSHDKIAEVVMDCPRGIPFRLKLLDEPGQPVAAEVTYYDVQPNPLSAGFVPGDARWPVSRAADRGNGIYEGFTRPGPGAIFVKTPGRADLEPAHVDPKAFFAPGRTDWTRLERVTKYGNPDQLFSKGCWFNQHDYAAIVLVNPTRARPRWNFRPRCTRTIRDS